MTYEEFFREIGIIPPAIGQVYEPSYDGKLIPNVEFLPGTNEKHIKSKPEVILYHDSQESATIALIRLISILRLFKYWGIGTKSINLLYDGKAFIIYTNNFTSCFTDEYKSMVITTTLVNTDFLIQNMAGSNIDWLVGQMLICDMQTGEQKWEKNQQ